MSEIFDPLRAQYTVMMPPRVIFGVDATKQIGTEAKSLFLKKGLIVTDPNLAKTPLVDRVKKPLQDEGLDVEVYHKIEAEPTDESITEAAKYTKGGDFDFVVGLGGGSSMDHAKSIAASLTNSAPINEYLAGTKTLEKPAVPIFTVPTTAGTGAEITEYAVFAVKETMVKSYLYSRFIQPSVAIVDPLMSMTMPPKLTASTGVDALCHATESIMSNQANPITIPLALQATRLISSNLRTAFYQGNNLEARRNMALGALIGPFSEKNALDVEAHAIGHMIGPLYKQPHGIACGLTLPYVMEHNLPVIPEKLRMIAEAMGEDIHGVSLREAGYRAVYAVKHLLEDLKLPLSMKEIGVQKDDIQKLADLEMSNPGLTPFHPLLNVKPTKETYVQLLTKIWQGDLGKS